MADPADLTPAELVEVLRDADGPDVSDLHLALNTRHELAQALKSDDEFQAAVTNVLEMWVTGEDL